MRCRRPPNPACPHRQRGVTLFELLMVTLVLAVVVSVGAAQFGGGNLAAWLSGTDRDVRDVADELVMELRRTRAQAMAYADSEEERRQVVLCRGANSDDAESPWVASGYLDSHCADNGAEEVTFEYPGGGLLNGSDVEITLSDDGWEIVLEISADTGRVSGDRQGRKAE